jgi:hypothetical protein
MTVVENAKDLYGIPTETLLSIFLLIWASFDGSIDEQGLTVLVPERHDLPNRSICDLMTYICEIHGVEHHKLVLCKSLIPGGKDIRRVVLRYMQ